MHLCTHLPLLKRVVLRRTLCMTYAVDNNMDIARFSYNQQRLYPYTETEFNEYFIQLCRIGHKLELTILDLHTINGLCRLGAIKWYQEDAFTLEFFVNHFSVNTTFVRIGLLTEVKQCDSCHSHYT